MNLIELGIERTALWVQKATAPLRRAPTGYGSRGQLGRWVPGMPARWGQPTLSVLASGITPERMRNIVLKSPTASAEINVVLDYACGVKVHARHRDASQKLPPRAAKLLDELLTKPNSQDTERRFRRKLLRDLLILGYGAVEIERDQNGGVANLYVLDAARVRADFDKHGKILGYDQLDVYGQPIAGPGSENHTWTPDDIIWYTLDAASESQYPHSRVEQLFACAVVESLMLSFIGGRFTDSNVPFGLMDLGDVSEEELEDAITLWNQQVTEHDHPEHRIIFTGSKGGAKWLPFGYALREMEAPDLFSRIRLVMLSIMGVTVNEMGEADNVNKANGYNLTYTFKKRAIEPLLDEYTQTTTRRLFWESLNLHDIELGYEEIDSRDELLQAQIDDAHLKAGVVSINAVRNRRGDPNIDGGDEPTVNLGASIVPVSMIGRFADAQIQALEILNQQARVGIMQSLASMQQQTAMAQAQGLPIAAPDPAKMGPSGSLPLIRGAQPPEKFTTIDGTGSSTAKFKLPTPAMQPPKPATPQAARGPVQANRNAGLRKEDTNGA